MSKIRQLLLISSIFTLTACTSLPTGPSVMVLPGSSKNFDQFRSDDYECRNYAYTQVGGVTANKAATTSGAKSAAIGTGLGAASGAAIGGGEGAAIGAGAGLLAGSLAGRGSARSSSFETQYRYDIGYIQCMYAKGHRVPVSGRISNEQPASKQKSINISPTQPGFTPPPPPPGNPPPPPPQ